MAARKNVLCLFDVDGTLTKPRQKITDDLKSFLLNRIQPQVFLGLVSGSDYSKIAEQMGGEDTLSKFDYVFCENGLVYYKNGELKSKASILTHFGEQKLQKLINFALKYMSNIELPAKRGNFVEFRSGLINLCPVGRSCSQLEREQFAEYDRVYNVRQKFVEALQKEFADSELVFAQGGQISIDVYPQGWDKTYCLNHLKDMNFEQVHFFGDKTDVGGNDYEIFSDPRTIGHQVSSPDDTSQQLIKLLEL